MRPSKKRDVEQLYFLCIALAQKRLAEINESPLRGEFGDEEPLWYLETRFFQDDGQLFCGTPRPKNRSKASSSHEETTHVTCGDTRS